MKLFVLALSLVSVASFGVVPQSASRTSTQLHETFGLGVGEDTYENQPDFLKGEGEYKEWINSVNEKNMLNRKYNVIRRVRELDLLKATADQGILSKLEAQGLDLATIEKLLPALEEAGLLSIAGENQQLLVNLVAPLLVEGAPLLLPVVAGAIAAGPPAFFLAAAATGGAEVALIATGAEVPLIGLPAGLVAGLLLVPLCAVSTVAGVALGSLKK